MDKPKNAAAWTVEGYNLFAEEGLEGIQVERLARILNLNKSGFYHYFGDLDGFCAELLKLHEEKIREFLRGIEQVKTLDPEYLHLLMAHSKMVMVQVQLTRIKGNVVFLKICESVNRRVDLAIRPLWGNYLGIEDRPDLALRYHAIIRDMFYTRISFQNLNYPFLHALATEARTFIKGMQEM